jgi:hypothetical protein
MLGAQTFEIRAKKNFSSIGVKPFSVKTGKHFLCFQETLHLQIL